MDKEMGDCAFCGSARKDPYTCPRCSKLYCSIKCYRSEKHQICSESFYKDCVKNQLHGVKSTAAAGSSREGDERTKEMLEKYLRGDLGLEDGEALDSDDENDPTGQTQEEEHYLEKVLEDTLAGVHLDDGDIDRQLMARGVVMGEGEEEELRMFGLLDEDEKKAFAQFVEEMEAHEMEHSAFARKKKN